MTNIATALKSEIARVARKEVRAEIEGLKKASAQQRAAIAQLRRDIAELEGTLKRVQRTVADGAAAAAKKSPRETAEALGETPRRFSAARLEAHRKKLNLSAADYGKLVGVSGQSVYNWEQGKSKPTREMVKMLAFVKRQSPKAVLERVAELSAQAGGSPDDGAPGEPSV